MEKLCHNSEMFLKQEKIMSNFPRYGQIIDQFQNLSNHPIKIIWILYKICAKISCDGFYADRNP